MCESPRTPINVTIRYKPLPLSGMDTSRICITDTGTSIGNIYPDVTYLWNTGQKVCCIKPQTSGIYSVDIQNSCGMATNNMYVDIGQCDDCIQVPNVFTPNNDGHNDYFQMLTTCEVIGFNIKIYNRWGQQIFTSNDVSRSWDGSFNGTSQDVGVYIYVLDYQSRSTGIKKHRVGNVCLVK
jgi:gliding motility-associated-like protein